MKKSFLVFVFCMLLAGVAFTEEVRRADIFAGYSYMSADMQGSAGSTSRQNANGWESSFSVNLHKYFAAETDVSGHYRGNLLGSGVNIWDYNLLGGPRFNLRPAFFHVLFGVNHLTGNALDLSASQSNFALAIGGGVQVKVVPRYYVRTSVDWIRTSNNLADPTGPRVNQNNFRVSVGLAYHFGPDIRGAAYMREPANDQSPRQAPAADRPSQRSGCGVLWNCTDSKRN